VLPGQPIADLFSVSAARLMARRTGITGTEQLIWFDRSGKALGTLATTRVALNFRNFHPDTAVDRARLRLRGGFREK
jgi:hypothetical protein